MTPGEVNEAVKESNLLVAVAKATLIPAGTSGIEPESLPQVYFIRAGRGNRTPIAALATPHSTIEPFPQRG
jgi:hypothetical protein